MSDNYAAERSAVTAVSLRRKREVFDALMLAIRVVDDATGAPILGCSDELTVWDSRLGANQIQHWLLEASVDGEVLRDDQWERLKPFVPGGRKGKRGPRSDDLRFFDAILWLARSGARWRDMPEERFGPYQTIKRRYYRWIEQGVFDRIFEAVASEASNASNAQWEYR